MIIGKQMIDYYLLEQLVAFSESRTLSKAAQQLHISQPAMSNSMRKLENMIGIPLFNRSKSHIELNENGKVAVRYARKALKANHRIIAKTQLFYQNMHTMRIGACNSFIAHHFVENFQQAHPDQTMSVTVGNEDDLLNKLNNQNIDLAIFHRKKVCKGLTTRYYLDEQISLTLMKDSPLAQQTELHFADLTGQSILAHLQAAFWLDIFRANIPRVNLIIQEKMATLDQLVHSSDLPVFNSSLVCDQANTMVCYKYQIPTNKVTIPIADQTAHAQYYFLSRTADQSKLALMGFN